MWLLLNVLLTLSSHAADPDDDDGDGYGESSGDCDDRDATIYPGAPERCDGEDQDCDGTIDEGTGCFDDDGDGFSEDEGDCSDTDAAVNPSATELYNLADDDCDGTIDEGTVGFDDDGDGFSELEGDCDDADVTTSPALPDYCRDGLDSDCSGIADDNCLEDPDDGCDPDITIRLASSRFSGAPGDTVSLEATPAFHDTALLPSFSWFAEAGEIADVNADSTLWTLPEQAGTYVVIVSVSDACGFEGLDELEVEVAEDPIFRGGAYAGGCLSGQAPTPAAALLLPLPALLISRRRRRPPTPR